MSSKNESPDSSSSVCGGLKIIPGKRTKTALPFISQASVSGRLKPGAYRLDNYPQIVAYVGHPLAGGKTAYISSIQ